MRVPHVLLTLTLLYAHSVVAAEDIARDERQLAPERWGDLAPEYGSCDERARLSGIGAPWVAARAREDVAREFGRSAAPLPQPEKPESSSD